MTQTTQHPGDEIPGWTGYIHSQHRHREDYEYVNYWKWVEKSCEKEKLLGVQGFTRSRLIDALSDLDQDRRLMKEDLEEKIAYSSKEAKNLQTKIARIETAKIKLENSVREQKKYANETHTANQKLLSYMDKFGDHAPDCACIELAMSGRIVNKEEKEICTCGWCEAKEDQSTFKQIIIPHII